MKGPKVVLIGAGSVFFGRQTVWSMVTKDALNNGTLALVDPNKPRLDWMTRIARRAIEARGVALKLEPSTTHTDVLKGADFIILAFAVEGVKLRGLDAEISTKHGMIMCSADTIGPGGIMRTVREVPRQTAILKDVEKLCPDAWVINWVNPSAAMGMAIRRNFPKLKSMAICDGPHNPRFDDGLIVQAGLAKAPDEITDALRSRVRIKSAGPNHFNWLIEMTHNGTDLTPRIKASLRKASQADHRPAAADGKEKVDLSNRIAWQLADAFGYVPMCVWHTQEYLPYFQGHDVDLENALTIRKWSIEKRKVWMREHYADMRALAGGKRPIEDFLASMRPDHASDIIEAMWAGLPKKFYINQPNNGAVTNMTGDAYLELLSVVDMNGVCPLPFGEIPRPLTGYMQRILDEHELAAEAAATCDRKTLLKAFLAGMTGVSIPDAANCMNEMLRRERRYIPEGWFA